MKFSVDGSDMRKLLASIVLIALVSGCGSADYSPNRTAELERTDAVFGQVDQNAADSDLPAIFNIDHSRLGAEADAVLDASKVSFYTNPENNSRLLADEIRAGLDLPYRVQAFFHEGDFNLVFTDAGFVATRHGLGKSSALERFNRDLAALTADIADARPVPQKGLTRDYGIVELESDFGYEESIARLKETILAEGDTVWFHDIDYQKQAKDFGIDLPRASLLVFGAPAPGAKAMRDYPSIGLDAFGQKLLVYEDGGKVKAIYNDIPAMARLHYGSAGFVHHFIGYRLKGTLSGAISKDG